MSTDQPLVIEVFADVGCPFAHLGLLAVLDQCRQRDRHDVVLRVRSWPLELVNGKPLDAGFIAEEIDEIRPQVAPDRFARFSAQAFPGSTLAAMELSAAAYAIDDRTGQAVALAVRDALFEQGRDVGDPEVLASIAAEHGVSWPPEPDGSPSPARWTAQQVRDDWDEGVRRGVVGSPHFFTPDGGYFCPALDVSRDGDGHLRVTADRDVFASFVDGLLGPG
jgi:predicted DsbA family dithiol-disulfide isomerase